MWRIPVSRGTTSCPLTWFVCWKYGTVCPYSQCLEIPETCTWRYARRGGRWSVYDVGVPTQVYPERGLPELTGDARVDRWREHRAKVRAELVEATLNAIDELGPDLSIDDVLKSAGISRPKLYRFFTDKEALFAAVAMRVQELVVERVVSNIDLSVSLLELFRTGMAGYVDLVDERPNLVRFLLGVQYANATSLIESGRPLSDAIAQLVGSVFSSRGGNADHIEYVIDAMLASTGIAVLRWFDEPVISKETLVDELVVYVWGGLAASAKARGVELNPDDPILLPTD